MADNVLGVLLGVVVSLTLAAGVVGMIMFGVRKMARARGCGHHRRGPIRPDDSQECLDCGLVFVSDG